MRKIVAAAALSAGLAATFAPLTPASAYCMADLSSVGGPSCWNPCTAVLGTYETADRTANDKLPEHGLLCPM